MIDDQAKQIEIDAVRYVIMKYKVWHNCQVGKASRFFFLEVNNIEEAWLVLHALWEYDWFQYRNHIKTNFSTTSGLEYFDEYEDDWCEWYDDNGLTINDYLMNGKAPITTSIHGGGTND